MAFRFKDLMIQVMSQDTGHDGQVCTIASKPDEPDPGAAQQPPCTPATSPAALVPCTMASKIEPANITCTPATYPTPANYAAGTGIVPCTMASQIPTPFAGVAAAGGTAAALTTVTTVTTITTLVGGGTAATNLSSLKEELRQALARVEEQERAAAQAQAGLPASVEESDDLERRLREAIEELREHRKTLEKPAKGAKGGRKGKK